MVRDVQLSLMIGPMVPLPVPREVIEALSSVEVKTTAGQANGFQLQFTLSSHSPLHTIFMLAGGAMPPLIRVIIIATISGTPNVLMDGVMTNHEITPGTESGQATLTVSGFDLSTVMNYGFFSTEGMPFPAMPPEVRVLLILAKYAMFGIVPLVIPSVLIDVPIPTDRIPLQKGKDLEYIQDLAAEVGYVFYIDPGPAPGMSVAYWGPEIKVGVAQPALTLDMDAYKNVETLTFSLNADAKKLPIVWIHNQATKAPIPIPIPDIASLNPQLGAIPLIPKEIENIKGTSKLSPVRAAMIGLAKAAKFSEGVSASGTLDVTRYGRVLKARQLVGVRGAGPAFNGLYYVSSVTHNIKRGEYKQSFSLTRNGLLSTVPKVPAA